MRLKNLIINQHQKIKNFRLDFDEDTHDYFIRIDFNFFKKQGYISDDNKINPLALYKAKCELNKIIKENTNDEKLKMIPILIHKFFGYPLYEITVK